MILSALVLLVPVLTTPIGIAQQPKHELGKDVPKNVQVDPGTTKAWMLLTSAVVFERNGDRHDFLAGTEMTPTTVADSKQVLKDSWDITQRTGLLATLDWLMKEGHRKEFDDIGKQLARLSEGEVAKALARIKDPEELHVAEFAAKNWSRLGEKSLLGWDLARYTGLCRWGYAAGMLTEDEAWQRMLPAAKRLQKAFKSWVSLGENYCLGYELWHGDQGEETRKALEKLAADEKSPWKTTPWDLKLELNLAKPDTKKIVGKN